MSIFPFDRKTFSVQSGKTCIKDIAGKSEIHFPKVKTGKWSAFALYDDDNKIERVVIGYVSFLDVVDSGRYGKGYSAWDDSLRLKSGIVCMFDEAHENSQPSDLFDGIAGEKALFKQACSLTMGKSFDEVSCTENNVFFKLPLRESAYMEVVMDDSDNSIVGLMVKMS